MYGDDLVMHRKYMHHFVGTKAAVSHLHPGMEVETRRLLLRILRNPADVEDHIRLWALICFEAGYRTQKS